MPSIFRKIKLFLFKIFSENIKSSKKNQPNNKSKTRSQDKEKLISPAEGFIQIIQNTEAQNAIAGIAEVGVDSFIQSGVYRDIPCLSSLIGPIRAIFSIRDYLFIKKLIIFINSYESIEAPVKEKFLRKISDDLNYRQFVGEHLISALDRYSQVEKATAIAKFFGAYISGSISKDEFLRYSYIIETVDWNLMPHLQYFYVNKLIYNAWFYNKKYGIWVDIRNIDYKERIDFLVYLGLPVERDRFGNAIDNFLSIQNFAFTGLISIDLGKVEPGRSDIEAGYLDRTIVTPTSYSINEFGSIFLSILELHIDPSRIKDYFADRNFSLRLDENPGAIFEGIKKIWRVTKI